jgi:hypothetical protein
MASTTQNPIELLLAALAAEKGQLLHCRCCKTAISCNAEKIEIGLSHQHRFSNPAGIVFTIGCFQHAPGCALQGNPCAEHSWFGNYRWQLALCSECHEHLGWYYQNPHQKFFFALISDRLTQQHQ